MYLLKFLQRRGGVSPLALTVMLLAAAGSAIGGSIPEVTVTLDDATLTEGNPAETAQITVSRSSSSGGLSVEFLVSDDVRIETDYDADELRQITSTVRRVVFLSGESTIVVPLTGLADNQVEGEESFTVQVQPSSNYTIAPGSEPALEFTITDDPPRASISLTPTELTEGGMAALLEISRSGGRLDRQLSTRVNFTLGSATPGSSNNDFSIEGVNGGFSEALLFIPGGSTTRQVELYPNPDNVAEGEETIGIVLIDSGNSSNNYLIDSDTIVATLADDVAVVRLIASDPDASENGDGGEFEISRNGGRLDQNLFVYLEPGGTAAGPGENNRDYDLDLGQNSTGRFILLDADETVRALPVLPRFDLDETELDETVILTLRSDVGEYVVDPVDNTATVTIANVADLILADGFEAPDQQKRASFETVREEFDLYPERFLDLGPLIFRIDSGVSYRRCADQQFDWGRLACSGY